MTYGESGEDGLIYNNRPLISGDGFLTFFNIRYQTIAKRE